MRILEHRTDQIRHGKASETPSGGRPLQNNFCRFEKQSLGVQNAVHVYIDIHSFNVQLAQIELFDIRRVNKA